MVAAAVASTAAVTTSVAIIAVMVIATGVITAIGAIIVITTTTGLPAMATAVDTAPPMSLTMAAIASSTPKSVRVA